ncbi:MBL fold metallo-hydrolase [Candidatus Neptunochlamydia vexilliferae]|uniref:MBL fold metallo-hydrolase n=1 Tax=Candidatus Neptunichlamydia vexilliferae TaxID=1651774 RepID=UPI0018916E98|nr:MBL fold metallo-hydrolase [Candidatus Neptunochlamydia vexilliferae]
MQLLFLGTGGSMGIPVIGCRCLTCKSKSPHDKRLRSSVLLTHEGKRYLVDIGPDYRQQALKYGIDRLDGLLITHTHYDHIAGLDELRIYTFRQRKPVPCLVSRETLAELKVRYHYFIPPHETTKLEFSILEGDVGETVFEGLPVTFFSYRQQGMKVTGFRFKNLAYVTDIKEYEESIFDSLKGVETLVISGWKWEKSHAHLSLKEGMAFARKAKAKMCYFTHISHELKADKRLPKGFALAYDGLEIGL